MTTDSSGEDTGSQDSTAAPWGRAEWALSACASATAVAFVVAVVSPLTLWNLEGPPRSALEHLTLLLGEDTGGLLRFAGSAAVSFAAYAYACRVAPRVRNLHLLAGMTIGLALVMFAAAPTGSYDIYHYLAEGRIAAHYHLNPLLVAPMSVPDAMNDPVLRTAQSWGTMPGRYGPLHLLIVQLVATITGDRLVLGIAGIKLLAVGAYLLAAWSVRSVAEAVTPRSGTAATVAFALNPVILYEGVVNAHIDIFMAALACAGIAALLRHRMVLAGLLLVASALVKFMTAPVLLFALIYGLRGENASLRSKTLVAMAVGAVFAVALYAPYFDGWKTLPFATASVQQSVSIYAIIEHVAPSLLPSATRAMTALAGLLCLASAIHVARTPTARALSEAAVVASLALMFLVSQMWWPWYTITLLAVAIPLGPRAREWCMTLTLGAVVATIVFMWRARFGVAEWNSTAYNFLMVGAAFGPAATWAILRGVTSA